jgi:hypothetical protein
MMENTPFNRISSPHRHDHPAVDVEILDSGGLAAIVARLEPPDFSIWCILLVKVQVTPHANLDALRPSIAAEWDQPATEYIHKTCSSFRHHLEAVVAKNAPSLNRCLANSPTYTNRYFSGQP